MSCLVALTLSSFLARGCSTATAGADYVQRVLKANFGASWDELGDENQVEETYALSSVNTLQAVKNLVQILGLAVCERSDKVPEGKSSHTLLLAGLFRTGQDVMVRTKLALNPADGSVTMNLAVTCDDVCIPWPCVNGECIDSGNDYTCNCNSGWEGRNCDVHTNECTDDKLPPGKMFLPCSKYNKI